MTKTPSVKQSLLTSAISMLLCVSMLVGTTFAWFTDSVTSGDNKIVAGNLDVQLWMHNGTDYVEITESSDPIFGSGTTANANTGATLWEPGKTQTVYLKVVNNGTLDLKYKIVLDVLSAEKELNKVLSYKISDNATAGSIADWASATGTAQAIALGEQLVSLDGTSQEFSLSAKSARLFALSVHMDENAGNEYKDGSITFDVSVLATQFASESDSFDSSYDSKADYEGEISSPESLAAAFAQGGSYLLASDVELTEMVNIPADKKVELNLNGNDLSYNEASGVAIYSEGDLTITGDGTIESAASAYAIRVQSGSLTIDSANIAVKGAFGAVSVFNGANVTINGGSFSNTGVAGKTSHVIYLGGYGTININGGSFVRGAGGDSGGVIVGYGWDNEANKKAIININGGYIASETAWGFISNYDGAWTEINVKGGTFNRNPSAYVVPGYTNTDNGDGTWTVSATKVSDSSALSGAIANGEAVELEGDVSFGSSISKDADISLNGNTFEATNTITLGNDSDLTMSGGSYAVNGTYGHVDVRPSTAEGSVVLFEDVDFSFNKKNVTNGPSTDRLGSVVEVCATATDANTVIVFKNCTFDNAQVLFEGMSGKTGTFDATFENCTFNALTSSAPIYVQNYVTGTITVKNCEFNLSCTSSTASAISISPSSSTSVTLVAENNKFNATAATPYTYNPDLGETAVDTVKVNGTPSNIKFVSAYSNSTVTVTGTVSTGIAAQ